MTFRWFLGLCIVKNRVVGRIYQLPAGPDQIARGSVQKQAPWQATGMVDDWEDTDLGSMHHSREEAARTIEGWYMAKVKSAPCAAHSQYRKDCIPCQEFKK